MNLKELVDKYCQRVVKHCTVGTVSQIKKGTQLNRRDMEAKGKYPVINGGMMPSGYVGKFNYEANRITIAQGGASAGYVQWISRRFWASAHCYVVEPLVSVINKYLFYFLKSQENKLKGSIHGAGIPALKKEKICNLKLPVPPLPVQEEIVRILDKFTNLTNELNKKLKNELDLRKKQYEYYRDKLLSFDGGGVKHELLKCMIKSINIGINPRKFFKLNPSNPIGFYVTVRELNGLNGVRQYNQSDLIDGEAISILNRRSDIEEGDILFSNTGTVGKLALVISKPKNWGVNEGICVIKPLHNIILSKFLYYFLDSSTARSIYNKKLTGSTLKHITRSDLLKILVPIPPLSVQKEIVEKLDRFNELCNEATKGLPAEIQMREKQYEYYRDKLLSFEGTQCLKI